MPKVGQKGGVGRQLRNLFGEVAPEIKPRVVFTRKPEVLFTGNLPAPMHGMAPRVVLGQSWWNKERKAAEERTGGCCVACGVHKSVAKGRNWIEGHEVYEVDYVRCTMRYLRTEPLCHFCHAYTHRGRLQALLDCGNIHHAKYVAVIQHGDRVVREAGLTPPKPYEGTFEGTWTKWRLVIGRKKYKGLFTCLNDWLNYHKEKNDE